MRLIISIADNFIMHTENRNSYSKLSSHQPKKKTTLVACIIHLPHYGTDGQLSCCS